MIWGNDRASAAGDAAGTAYGSGGTYGGAYAGSYALDGLITGTQMYMTSGSVQVYYESEQTAFSTTGTVQTADGRSIDFGLEVAMSREFIEYTGVKIDESIILKDPLVINLDGNPSSVSDQKFYFDIDSDGKADLIPQPGSPFIEHFIRGFPHLLL